MVYILTTKMLLDRCTTRNGSCIAGAIRTNQHKGLSSGSHQLTLTFAFPSNSAQLLASCYSPEKKLPARSVGSSSLPISAKLLKRFAAYLNGSVKLFLPWEASRSRIVKSVMQWFIFRSNYFCLLMQMFQLWFSLHFLLFTFDLYSTRYHNLSISYADIISQKKLWKKDSFV